MVFRIPGWHTSLVYGPKQERFAPLLYPVKILPMSSRGSEFEKRRQRSPINTTTLFIIIEYFLPRYSLYKPPPKDPTKAPMTYSEAKV